MLMQSYMLETVQYISVVGQTCQIPNAITRSNRILVE